MDKISPITATVYPVNGRNPYEVPLVKTVIRLLPSTETQQETVYTYNKWGQLESTVVRGHRVNLLT
jgi:hypothetical protein